MSRLDAVVSHFAKVRGKVEQSCLRQTLALVVQDSWTGSVHTPEHWFWNAIKLRLHLAGFNKRNASVPQAFAYLLEVPDFR